MILVLLSVLVHHVVRVHLLVPMGRVVQLVQQVLVDRLRPLVREDQLHPCYLVDQEVRFHHVVLLVLVGLVVWVREVLPAQ